MKTLIPALDISAEHVEIVGFQGTFDRDKGIVGQISVELTGFDDGFADRLADQQPGWRALVPLPHLAASLVVKVSSGRKETLGGKRRITLSGTVETEHAQAFEANSLEGWVLAYLTRHRAEGALWTGDIALGLRRGKRQGDPTTYAVNRALKRLLAVGAVVKVCTGNPSSWCLPGAQL